jgi:UrcA family protein
MFHRSNTAAAVFSAALVLAAIPVAAGAAETRTVVVHSQDLNLTADAGRAALQQRIAHAVGMVCGTDFARTTQDIQAYATCRKQVLASTAPQFNLVVAKAQAGKKVAMGSGAAE